MSFNIHKTRQIVHNRHAFFVVEKRIRILIQVFKFNFKQKCKYLLTT